MTSTLATPAISIAIEAPQAVPNADSMAQQLLTKLADAKAIVGFSSFLFRRKNDGSYLYQMSAGERTWKQTMTIASTGPVWSTGCGTDSWRDDEVDLLALLRGVCVNLVRRYGVERIEG